MSIVHHGQPGAIYIFTTWSRTTVVELVFDDVLVFDGVLVFNVLLEVVFTGVVVVVFKTVDCVTEVEVVQLENTPTAIKKATNIKITFIRKLLPFVIEFLS